MSMTTTMNMTTAAHAAITTIKKQAGSMASLRSCAEKRLDKGGRVQYRSIPYTRG